MEEKRSCATCGFLALRRQSDDALVEANKHYRTVGAPNPAAQRLHWMPICFAMAKELQEELELPLITDISGSTAMANGDKVLAVIRHDRSECVRWARWQQGFTPKEHQEMFDRQEWRDWQEHQRKSDRKWRLIELAILALLGGAFTALGAWIVATWGTSP